MLLATLERHSSTVGMERIPKVYVDEYLFYGVVHVTEEVCRHLLGSQILFHLQLLCSESQVYIKQELIIRELCEMPLLKSFLRKSL